MPPKMHKKTSFYLCLVLSIFYLGFTGSKLASYNVYDREGWVWGLVLFVVFSAAAVLLKRRNDRERAEYEKALAEQAETARILRDAVRAERTVKQERQSAWEKENGVIKTKIAGVTFENDDGSSRQAILKDAYVNGGEGTLDLEAYDYKGAQAVRVLYENQVIGNIPAAKSEEVAAVLDRLITARLDVEKFTAEDGEDGSDTIYRADLTVIYKKDHAPQS